MGDIGLLPVISLIAGILILIKADLLNWVIALFLIAFGVLEILPAFGVPTDGVWDFLLAATKDTPA